ncbi:acetyltransferase-like isoleucine patch superfamily enzyme [Endobacter medicaginis]|uniref:Acetyltransferase-like isoleucine patch superfamily enzyme n=3 Tax=Endobacter medicaginis TaxID=1181271 RepID=A0A839V4V9_9PROT|nr:CatB-related O-acetyltransferase [Endobacter medicaginis]MBB3174491.1 acetyltransferase-like isoleucine patch superfamily enzyme [Endobacter medicaginis]MCX5475060.1 CatB-related O-acetyltransferase [Endobacter medicaginis]
MTSLYTLRTPLGASFVWQDGRPVETGRPGASNASVLLTPGPIDTLPILGEPHMPPSLGLLLGDSRPLPVRLAPTARPDMLRLRLDDDGVWSEALAIPSHHLPRAAEEAVGAIDILLAASDRAAALARLADAAPETAAAAAWLLAKPDALRAIALLRDHPAWPVLFAGLQSAASGGTRRFEHDTRHRLAPLIARYGWSIGCNSYGAPDVLDHDQGASLSIGSYCSMNSFTVVLANHTSRTVTTYPFRTLANWWPTMREHPEIEDHVGADVAIGSDVWVGRGVVVLPGTTVGDGAILGANTVARGVIPPYAVVVGNPGRVIRRRFADAEIERLLAIRWWDWPDWQVDRFSPLLSRPDLSAFFEAVDALSTP